MLNLTRTVLSLSNGNNIIFFHNLTWFGENVNEYIQKWIDSKELEIAQMTATQASSDLCQFIKEKANNNSVLAVTQDTYNYFKLKQENGEK